MAASHHSMVAVPSRDGLRSTKDNDKDETMSSAATFVFQALDVFVPYDSPDAMLRMDPLSVFLHPVLLMNKPAVKDSNTAQPNHIDSPDDKDIHGSGATDAANPPLVGELNETDNGTAAIHVTDEPDRSMETLEQAVVTSKRSPTKSKKAKKWKDRLARKRQSSLVVVASQEEPNPTVESTKKNEHLHVVEDSRECTISALKSPLSLRHDAQVALEKQMLSVDRPNVPQSGSLPDVTIAAKTPLPPPPSTMDESDQDTDGSEMFRTVSNESIVELMAEIADVSSDSSGSTSSIASTRSKTQIWTLEKKSSRKTSKLQDTKEDCESSNSVCGETTCKDSDESAIESQTTTVEATEASMDASSCSFESACSITSTRSKTQKWKDRLAVKSSRKNSSKSSIGEPALDMGLSLAASQDTEEDCVSLNRHFSLTKPQSEGPDINPMHADQWGLTRMPSIDVPSYMEILDQELRAISRDGSDDSFSLLDVSPSDLSLIYPNLENSAAYSTTKFNYTSLQAATTATMKPSRTPPRPSIACLYLLDKEIQALGSSDTNETPLLTTSPSSSTISSDKGSVAWTASPGGLSTSSAISSQNKVQKWKDRLSIKRDFRHKATRSEEAFDSSTALGLPILSVSGSLRESKPADDHASERNIASHDQTEEPKPLFVTKEAPSEQNTTHDGSDASTEMDDSSEDDATRRHATVETSVDGGRQKKARQNGRNAEDDLSVGENVAIENVSSAPQDLSASESKQATEQSRPFPKNTDAPQLSIWCCFFLFEVSYPKEPCLDHRKAKNELQLS